jgi:plasmid stabilization system protein ParE
MAQVRQVQWSLEAQENLDKITAYLENNWTNKELEYFFTRLEDQLAIISENPELYKKSSRINGLYECQVTVHNTLFYTFNNTTILIVTVFDNRQNPDKLSKF